MEFKIFENPKPETPFFFTSALNVYEKMKEYSNAGREILFALFLNSNNQVIHIEPISAGDTASAAVYPSEVFKLALYYNSSQIVLCHNHPSGNPEPSFGDKDITKSVVWAGLLFNIGVSDHVIIGNGSFYSFQENHLIEDYKADFLAAFRFG